MTVEDALMAKADMLRNLAEYEKICNGMFSGKKNFATAKAVIDHWVAEIDRAVATANRKKNRNVKNSATDQRVPRVEGHRGKAGSKGSNTAATSGPSETVHTD